MRDIKKIYVHCSYSTWGSKKEIDSWHKERGFDGVSDPLNPGQLIYCGYNFVVLNQFTTYELYKTYQDKGTVNSITDGLVEVARPIEEIPCHVKGDNQHSIGICYVGHSPTPLQLVSLFHLVKDLQYQYGIGIAGIKGHYEYYLDNKLPMEKTCPNFDMNNFRRELKERS